MCTDGCLQNLSRITTTTPHQRSIGVNTHDTYLKDNWFARAVQWDVGTDTPVHVDASTRMHAQMHATRTYARKYHYMPTTRTRARTHTHCTHTAFSER